MSDTVKNSKFSGYRVAIGCAIVCALMSGVGAAYGVIMPSYLSEMGWSLTSVSFAGTVSSLLSMLITMFGVALIMRLTPKKSLYIGILAGGFSLIVRGLATNLVYVYVGAILNGLSIALATHFVCSTIISAWFIDKRKSVLGYALGVAPFGSALFIFITGRLIVAYDWRIAMYFLGAATLIGGLLATMICVRADKPEKVGQKPLGWEKAQEAQVAAGGSAQGLEPVGLTHAQALKTPSFWLIFVGLFFSAMLVVSLKIYAPTFFISIGFTIGDSANLATFLTIFCALATMLSGVIAEKFGNYVYIIYMNVLFIVGAFMLLSTNSSFAFMVAAMAVVSLASPSNTISPTILPDVFGMRDFAKINGNLTSAYLLGVALVNQLVGFIFDITGSFDGVWIALIVMAIASMACLLLALKLAPVKKLAAKQNSAV